MTDNYPPRVLRLERNRLGRDFVVGDLHGCFGQLEEALEREQFDARRDRVVSVGDLVDRGPDSAAALEWLRQPWFHACLGNHEEMMLQAPSDPAEMRWWMNVNGGDWWLDASEQMRAELSAECARLPLVIEVDTHRGRVGVVHADCLFDTPWPVFLRRLEYGDPKTRQIALWGRKRFTRGQRETVAGIDRVVCGHTISDDWRVRVLGNVWFIDTGAFLSPDERQAHLTLMNLESLFEGDELTDL